MAAYDVGRFTRTHSILPLELNPDFIPYHNIALIGTLSPSTIIPSRRLLATLAPD